MIISKSNNHYESWGKKQSYQFNASKNFKVYKKS